MGLVQHVYQRGVISNYKKKSTRANWDKDFFH